MPTGYTYNVQNGEITSVKDYIIQCAKGFGAFMHMRNESINSEIVYDIPSNYHTNKIEELKREYDEFIKLTDEEIQNRIDKEYDRKLKRNREKYIELQEQRQRYLVMIIKVQDWIPPTKEHENLKAFALEQLRNSLEADCSEDLDKYYLEKPRKLTLEEYRNNFIKSYVSNLEYHINGEIEEKRRCDERNQWIKDLVDSFN